MSADTERCDVDTRAADSKPSRATIVAPVMETRSDRDSAAGATSVRSNWVRVMNGSHHVVQDM